MTTLALLGVLPSCVANELGSGYARVGRDVDGGSARPCSSETSRYAIVHGERDHPDLRDSELRAIIYVLADGLECSAARVRPEWVVTAAHCVTGVEPRDVALHSAVGASPVGSAAARVREVHLHPELDVALLRVPETQDLIPLVAGRLSDEWRGRDTIAVGFGEDEAGRSGRRAFFPLEIAAVGESLLGVDGLGLGGPCHGDSGGPLLYWNARGAPVVVGILESGDGTCVGRAVYTRADRIRPWLEALAGPMAGECEE